MTCLVINYVCIAPMPCISGHTQFSNIKFTRPITKISKSINSAKLWRKWLDDTEREPSIRNFSGAQTRHCVGLKSLGELPPPLRRHRQRRELTILPPVKTYFLSWNRRRERRRAKSEDGRSSGSSERRKTDRFVKAELVRRSGELLAPSCHD